MNFSKKSITVLLDKLADQASQKIEQTHKQIIQNLVIYEAKNYAAKNLPAPEDENIEPFVGTIKGAYKSLKNDVALILKAGIQKGLGTVNMATVNEKIDSKRVAINGEQEKQLHLEADKGRLQLQGDYTSYKNQRILLVLFSIGECAWATMAFVRLGDIILLSAILGIMVGIAQILVTKSSMQAIKEIDDEQKRKKYLVLTFVGLFIVSLVIGTLRYFFVHTGAGAGVPFLFLNPLTFTIINMLFIAATALLVYIHYPRKRDIREVEKAEKIDKDLKAIDGNKKRLEGELKELMAERETFIELRTMLIHDEHKLQDKIQACYEQAIGQFAHENVIKRTDGKYPIAFKNPVNPLPKPEAEELLLISNHH